MGFESLASFLFGEDFRARGGQSYAAVVVVLYDRFDKIIRDVKRAGSVALWVANEDIRGGKFGGQMKLFAAFRTE